jgi:conjugative relaxase-like TrwC/TraI family protein
MHGGAGRYRSVPLISAGSAVSGSCLGVITAQSIGAAKGGGYARYLESKTIAPEPGVYYLTPEGEPTQPAGRWHGAPGTLRRLGIDGREIDGKQFTALMEGRNPDGHGWLRKAGADGQRGGGIDVTFSAPKSVSVEWALGDPNIREQVEAAHSRAVADTLAYIRASVPVVRRRVEGTVVEEPAADLLAAEYRHTTARGVVPGEMPDPQLHSHLVITTAVRQDGRFVAVASRPLFRAARDAGAYYRSALADHLKTAGYGIEAGTGRDGRYFELAGRPRELLDAFSARSREVAAAAERFRAKWGRAPERGELRIVKQENRRRKTLVHRGELDEAWRSTAEQVQRTRATVTAERPVPAAGRVEEKLTERAATFPARELRAVTLEQTVGQLHPRKALELAERMVHDGRIVDLGDGLLTTRANRLRETQLEEAFSQLADKAHVAPSERARETASREVAERIGHSLSGEQLAAVAQLTGRERAAVLIGPAGTGKGVTLDAAARAEQAIGREVFGIAVGGSTAQRLGRDTPALSGRTMTLDSLVATAEHGRLTIDRNTTVYLDEAGMADTHRLSSLIGTVGPAGAKLVLVGDPSQLPSIGAGGMLLRLAGVAPTAELKTVLRTSDPAEQRAWADLRHGRPERAMAHYQARGRLHVAPDRDQAVERAVTTWARLTRTTPVEKVALLSDASNVEIDRLNARAQTFRLERGELGSDELPIPDTHYGIRTGDRVATIEQHHPPDAPRIENGSRGTIINLDPKTGEAVVRFDGIGRHETFSDDDLGKLRLGYAQHIYRAQGATVDRALVLTGGWQTSREATYVEASRARHGTDWYVNREELGEEGHDSQRIARLAQKMRTSRAQTPSLEWAERRPADPMGRPALHELLTRILRRTTRTREPSVDRGW